MRRFLKVRMKMDAWPEPRGCLIPTDKIHFVDENPDGTCEITWAEGPQDTFTNGRPIYTRTSLLDKFSDIADQLTTNGFVKGTKCQKSET